MRLSKFDDAALLPVVFVTVARLLTWMFLLGPCGGFFVIFVSLLTIAPSSKKRHLKFFA